MKRGREWMKSPWRFIHKGNERGCFPRSPAFIHPEERCERRTRGAALLTSQEDPLYLARLIWRGVNGSKAPRTLCRGAVQDQRTRRTLLRDWSVFLSLTSLLPRSAFVFPWVLVRLTSNRQKAWNNIKRFRFGKNESRKFAGFYITGQERVQVEAFTL